MLVLPIPATDHNSPRKPRRRLRSAIVWQPHYDGFTTIAYQSGKAIAGISGPWSGQYVLIWWEQAQPIHQVELFDSLDEAKFAVAQALSQANVLGDLLQGLRREPAARAPGWLARVRRWLTSPRGNKRTVLLDHRRRQRDEECDLSGLNLRAVR